MPLVIETQPELTVTINELAGGLQYDKYLRVKLENDVAVTQLKIGLGTITYSFLNGVLTITSVGEFDNELLIQPNQGDAAYELVNVNTITVTPYTSDYGIMIIRIFKEK